MKTILELSNEEAKTFFLKQESYINFDLPGYFKFQNLIDKISAKIQAKALSKFYGRIIIKKTGKPTYPSNYENVNYKFLNNKDGKFAWRPFQLIHPAIYVSLVHKITEENNWNFIVNRINEFRQNPKIQC